MFLTIGELRALENLVMKSAGQLVDRINVTDAEALTDLGLAMHTNPGWSITPNGMDRWRAQGGTQH